MAGIKILVADAQHLFSQSLGMALKQYGDLDVLPEHPSLGVDAVDLALALSPDVSLVDYWMPDMEGAVIAERILRRAPDHKVILLSWFHGSMQIRRALEAGVMGFLPKSTDVEQVAEAIRGAARGEAIVLGAELMQLSQVLDDRYEQTAEISKRLSSLTSRELNVLMVLNTGVSIEDAAGQLYISVKTVKTHIGNILRKTQARSTSEALALARSCGLFR